ncbi:MAG TPA: GtrA family protein, partial [Candidatus Saccharimonadales bacterium]|nr:GtrA family protein [Candidatus Saccharimonadales bacterium]
FWGTYLGFPIFHEVLGWPSFWSLFTASLIGNILFFILDKKWVFADQSSGRRRTRTEVVRFTLFMTLNFFINLAIVEGLKYYFDVSEYIGQFVAAFFFTVWNYIGLKFWVFGQGIPHAYHLLKKELREYARSAH